MLPPELQSLVLDYLTPQHLLSTATRLCHSIARYVLTPSCFRTHLIVNDRTINALPTLSHSAFSRLTQATSVDVRYGDRAEERCCLTLFSANSDRSLLHFTHTRTLSVEYTDTWEFLNHATPLTLLQQLLNTRQSTLPAQQPLPLLTSLTLHGVPDYDNDDCLRSLLGLRLLRHLHVFLTWQNCAQLTVLLQLPELRELVCGNYQHWLSVAESDIAAVHGAFDARGVKLMLGLAV